MNERLELAPNRWSRAWVMEVIAFTLFLIMVGVLLAVPGQQWAWFAAGVGAILLGKNLVRNLIGIRVPRISLIVGGAALLTGLAGIARPNLSLWAIFLVLVGIALLGVALYPRSALH